MKRGVANGVVALLAWVGWSSVWLAAILIEREWTSNSVPDGLVFRSSGPFVTRTGELLVCRYRHGPSDEQPHDELTTLEGRPTDHLVTERLPEAMFLRPTAQPTWPRLVRSLQAGDDPPASWFTVRHAHEQRYHLVCYPTGGARPLRWLSRQGFTTTAPALDAWFAGRPSVEVLDMPTAVKARIDGAAARWRVGMLDGERLLLCDLLARTTRVLLTLPGAEGLESYSDSLGNEEVPAAQRFHGMAVRSADAVAFWQENGRTDRFALPPEASHGDLEAGITDPGLLLLTLGEFGRRATRYTLLWVRHDGSIARRATAVSTSTEPPRPPMRVALAATCPLLPLFAAIQIDCRGAMGDYGSDTWFQFSEWFPDYRAALPWWLGLGLLAAMHVLWRHRRLGQRGSLAWAVFVLVGGVPAWLTWRFGRFWPTLTICPGCGLETPSTRLTCRRCGDPVRFRPRREHPADEDRRELGRHPLLALVWKEWRELRPALAVVLPALVYWCAWHNGIGTLHPPNASGWRDLTSWHQFEESLQTPAIALAALCGLWLGLVDDRRRTWPWLSTRPLPRRAIAAVRILTGLVLVELLVVAPTLVMVAWALTPGCYPAPFSWSLPAPALWQTIGVAWWYIAGWVVARRKARWYGTRLLPLLGVAVLSMISQPETMLFFGWLLVVNVAATVLALAALIAWVATEGWQ